LAQKLIWIESNGCDQRIQLIARKLLSLFRARRRRCHDLRLGLLLLRRLGLLRLGGRTDWRYKPDEENDDHAVKRLQCGLNCSWLHSLLAFSYTVYFIGEAVDKRIVCTDERESDVRSGSD
jgi:hypothetical protein